MYPKITFLLANISALTMGTLNAIDLKLHEKPNSIDTYEWCAARATKFVNEKRNNLLTVLNVSQKEWALRQASFDSAQDRQGHRNGLFSQKNKHTVMPENIRQSIHNILENPKVQRDFGITSITSDRFQIIAHRKNGQKIYFIPTHSQAGLAASTQNTIYINPGTIQRVRYTNAELTATLGHELAHVLCEHYLDRCVIHNINRSRSNSTFRSALHEFYRAQETQADLMGSFNNQILIQTKIKALKTRTYASEEKDPIHPSTHQSLNYFNEMYQSIQNDSEKKTKDSLENKIKIPNEPAKQRNKENITPLFDWFGHVIETLKFTSALFIVYTIFFG